MATERYRLLFWPPWVEKFNALMRRLEEITLQAELRRLHSQLLRVGLDYLMMGPRVPEDSGDPV